MRPTMRPNMWLVIVCCLVLALLGAASAESPVEPGWAPGVAFTYSVRSRSLASPLGQRFSGVLGRARLRLAADAARPHRLNAKVEAAEWARVEAKVLSPGWNAPLADAEFDWKPMKFVAADSFAIDVQDGAVQRLWVPEGASVHDVNWIRAVVAPLQLNTAPEAHVGPSASAVPPQPHAAAARYAVMESSPMGECVTQYEASPLPAYMVLAQPQLAPAIVSNTSISSSSTFVRVVKSVDLDACAARAVYQWGAGTRSSKTPGGAAFGDAVARSTVTRLTLEGNLSKYVIHSAITVTKMAASPFLHDTEKATSNAMMNLTLIAMEAGGKVAVTEKLKGVGLEHEFFKDQQSWSGAILETRLPSPFNPKTAADEQRFQEAIPSLAKRIAKHLAGESTLFDEGPLAYFTVFTRIVRTSSYAQLKQQASVIFKEDTTNCLCGVVFRDAVAEAGTGPALMLLSDWIEDGSMDTAVLARLVSTLPRAVRHPDQNYLRFFFEKVVLSERALRAQALNVSAAVALAQLARRSAALPAYARAHYPLFARAPANASADSLAADLTSIYIPYFTEQLRRAVDMNDSHAFQVYVHALGQTAHPAILTVLRPFLSGQDPRLSTYQRALVVRALVKLAWAAPEIARPVLAALLDNTAEAWEVRVDAVHALLCTQPSAAQLQRLALATREEPSKQVAAAVASALRAAALLADYRLQRLAANARAAVPLLAPEAGRGGAQLSRSLWRDFFMDEPANLGYSSFFTYTGSRDSLLPKALYWAVNLYPGEVHTGTTDFSALTSSVKKLMNILNPFDNGGEGENADPSATKETSANDLRDYNDSSSSPNAPRKPQGRSLNVSGTLENWGHKIKDTFHDAYESVANFFSKNRTMNKRLAPDYHYNGYDNDAPNYELSDGFSEETDQNQEDVVNAGQWQPGTMTRGASMRVPYSKRETRQSGGGDGGVWAPTGVRDAGPRGQEPFEGQLRFPVPGGETFLAFDEAQLNNLKQSFLKAMFRSQELSYHKLFFGEKLKLVFPDGTGNIMFFYYNTPTYLSWKASLKPEINSLSRNFLNEMISRPVSNPQEEFKWGLGATGELSIKYSRVQQSGVGVMDYKEGTARKYMAGAEKKLAVSLGASVVASVAAGDRGEGATAWSSGILWSDAPPLAVNWTVRAPAQPLLRYALKPFLVQQSSIDLRPAVDADAHIIAAGPVHETLRRWGPVALNVSTENALWGLAAALREARPRDALSYLFFPLAHASMRRDAIAVHLREPLETSFSLRYDPAAAIKMNGVPDLTESVLNANTSLVLPASHWEWHHRAKLSYYSTPFSKKDFLTYKQREWLAGKAVTNAKHSWTEMEFSLSGIWGSKPIIDYEEALSFDPASVVDGKLTFWNESMKTEFGVVCRGRRSAERLTWLRSQPGVHQCERERRAGYGLQPACLWATREAGAADLWRCEANAAGGPSALRDALWATWVGAAPLRAPLAIYAHHAVPSARAAARNGTLNATWFVAPDARSVSFQVSMPSYVANWTALPLWGALRPLLLPHPHYEALRRLTHYSLNEQDAPKCVLDGDHVTTFDNTTYTAATRGAWYTAITTNGSASVTHNVTIQALDTSDGKKSVRVLLGDGEAVEAVGATELLVQGRSQRLKADRVQSFRVGAFPLRTYLASVRGPLLLMLPVHGITLVLGPRGALLYAANEYRGALRGLCGVFDGEPLNDLQDPEGMVHASAAPFAVLWADAAGDAVTVQAQERALLAPRAPETFLLVDVVGPAVLSQALDTAYNASAGRSWRIPNDPSLTPVDLAPHHMSPVADRQFSSIEFLNVEPYSNSNPASNPSSNAASQPTFNPPFADDPGRSPASNRPLNLDSNAKPSSAAYPQPDPNTRENPIKTTCRGYEVLLDKINGQYCFSKQAVMSCRPPCQAESIKELKVAFHCIADGGNARHYEQQIRSGALPDFSRKSTTVEREMRLPAACS